MPRIDKPQIQLPTACRVELPQASGGGRPIREYEFQARDPMSMRTDQIYYACDTRISSCLLVWRVIIAQRGV